MAINGVRATAAALAVTAGTASGLGQTTWQGGYSQSWNDYQNWQPQQLPAPTSDVIIPETAGQVECNSMLLLEIGSIDCRSGLYLFNTILAPSGSAYVKNLLAGGTRAGGLFTLDGEGQLGTHWGGGGYLNIGTYSYGTAYIQGTEFRNSGTIEGYSLGVVPDGQTPGVLKNTGTIKLGMTGFGGSLTGSGQGSHILNQGTIVKQHAETVTLGGGDGIFPGFIQESGAVAVQAGVLYCSGHTTWEGGTVSIASGAILRLYAGGGGPHYFFGLPAISGQGTLLLEPASPGFSGGPIVYARDLTLQMGAPGKAVWGGSSHQVGEATLTNGGDVEWTTGGFSKVTPQSQALIRNQGNILIPSTSPGVSTGVDLVSTWLIDQNSSLALLDGARLTNQGLLTLRRGSINGSIGSRVINENTIDSPADAAPELAAITVPLDMDGALLQLTSGGTFGSSEADVMLTAGGVWKNGSEAQVGDQRELRIPGGVYTFEGPGNRFYGTGTVLAYYWSQTGSPILRVEQGGELELAMSHGEFKHMAGYLGGAGTIRNKGNLDLFGGAIGVNGEARLENYSYTEVSLPTTITGTIVNAGTVKQDWQGSITLDGVIWNLNDGVASGAWYAKTSSGAYISGPSGVFHNQGSFVLFEEPLAPPSLNVSVRFNNTGKVTSYSLLMFTGPVDQIQAGVLTGGTWETGLDGSIDFPAAITKIGASAVVTGAESIPALASLVEVAGELNVASIASFPNLSTITGSGRINFPDGTTLQAQSGLNVGAPSILSGGRVIAESSPEAFLITPLLTSNGRVIPGDEDGAAIIDLTGDYQQNATGRLEIELGGLTPGMQHDVFEISGQAALAGTLKVALIDDFVPSIGDEFTVLTAGSIVGTFDTLDLPALPAGRAWEVLYAPGGEQWVIVRVIDSCYPDCNQSGTLTVADFGCFQTKFVIGDPYADCNTDGHHTVADFGCFQTKFVIGCP